jgi:hypothetical protein
VTEVADNDELRLIIEADQRDRQPPDWQRMIQEDPKRRARVLELLAEGAVQTASDHYRAALVLQHGHSLDDYERARDLASYAADRGHRPARWLAAAAEDRWLMMAGRPQRFGTQFRAVHGRWTLHAVDPATTDDDRAAAGVPSLAEQLARAQRMTATDPPPHPSIPSSSDVQLADE